MKALFNLAIAMNLFAAIISLIAHNWGYFAIDVMFVCLLVMFRSQEGKK